MDLGLKDYGYDSGNDYSAGRVAGDALLMAASVGAIIVITLITTITGGADIAFGSGGTLAIGGVSICVGGVIAGSAEAVVGGESAEFINDLYN